MSYWKTILIEEREEIAVFSYPKLNCVQQEIAELIEKYGVTNLEGRMVLRGLLGKEMLNLENTLKFHRIDNEKLYKIEGIE